MKASEYTPEQMQNALLYGACLTCGTPRELHRGEEIHPDGRTTHWQGLVAPCGHSQNPNSSLDPIYWPPYENSPSDDSEKDA